jgi:serine/threonine protein kinase
MQSKPDFGIVGVEQEASLSEELEPDTTDSLIRAVASAPRRKLAAPELEGLGFARQDAATRTLSGPDEGRLDLAEAGVPALGSLVDGRYVLERVIGSGGMGVVFAARNAHTDKKVALKVLMASGKRGKEAKARAARFLREAKAAGRVRHPNVVDMIDVGGDPAQAFLVMELLQGRSLRERMQEGPMPISEALDILVPAMRGIREAHRQGVIHRDVKPENIFLHQAEDGTLTPKVVDFGVSRITDNESPGSMLTKAGNVLGTLRYMPLEQLRGKANVDARADVYALGVVLYEAIAGARPYDADNEHDLGIKMATELPRSLMQRVPGLDPRLDAVVMRALARIPEDRYPSVEAFMAAVAAARSAPPRRVPGLWLVVGGLVLSALVWGTRALPGRTPQQAQPPWRTANASGDARSLGDHSDTAALAQPRRPDEPVAESTVSSQLLPEVATPATAPATMGPESSLVRRTVRPDKPKASSRKNSTPSPARQLEPGNTRLIGSLDRAQNLLQTDF